jgi:hypothetical protein
MRGSDVRSCGFNGLPRVLGDGAAIRRRAGLVRSANRLEGALVLLSRKKAQSAKVWAWCDAVTVC